MKTTYLSVLVAAAILGAPQETLGAFKLTTLFSFSETNGIFPYGRMNQARDGNFYGTTFLWGQGYYGTVFKLSPSGRLSTVVAFDGTNGYEPWAGLVQAADGTLYGTTQAGGPQMAGSIFAISAYKRFQNICFLDETNGFYPHGFMPNGLIIATDGNLYGTTISGGDFDSSTVLKLTTNGEPTTLFSFTRTNGWQPRSDLVQGSDGDLYGTTTYGGERWERGDGNGTVFRIKTDGSLVWLNSFSKTNGLWPIGQLIECGGAFYGTTASGGTYDTIDEGSGTIFKVTPEGTLSVVYSFSPVEQTTMSGTAGTELCSTFPRSDLR